MEFLIQVESGKLVLEVAEFDLGRELEGLVDMFSVQCINHDVETVLDLSGISIICSSCDIWQKLSQILKSYLCSRVMLCFLLQTISQS